LSAYIKMSELNSTMTARLVPECSLDEPMRSCSDVEASTPSIVRSGWTELGLHDEDRGHRGRRNPTPNPN